MIKAHNITHLYGEDIALNDVNITIKKGEFIAIVGESGSGKSTLLSILSTLLTSSSGEVLFEGENYKDIKNIDEFRKKNIGFIFQFHYLIEYLSVYDNLKIANEDSSDDEIMDLLTLLDIQGLRKKLPNEISGGQRQRVAIARALINRPTVVFADEPTGNLDSKNALRVFDIFRELAKKGVTIIVTTHNKELADLADKIIEVKDGQV